LTFALALFSNREAFGDLPIELFRIGVRSRSADHEDKHRAR
jgi:hypothetical protein